MVNASIQISQNMYWVQHVSNYSRKIPQVGAVPPYYWRVPNAVFGIPGCPSFQMGYGSLGWTERRAPCLDTLFEKSNFVWAQRRLIVSCVYGKGKSKIKDREALIVMIAW